MSALKVLFDTDPGVDDAAALLLLARSPEVALLGVTTVFGNAGIAQVTENARCLTALFGLDVPVAQGAGRALVRASGPPPAHVHGQDGLGEAARPDVPARPLDPRPAHGLIADTLRAHPGEITLIAVGRLTNLSLLLMHDPGAAALARSVVVMGGAFGVGGPNGNVTPLAEANILGDPHAADHVFAADWPVTVVGLDVTRRIRLPRERIAAMAGSGDAGARFVGRAKRLYADYHTRFGVDGCYVHDSSAVACALNPDAVPRVRGRIHVVTEGLAEGQTVLVPDAEETAPNWSPRPSQSVAVDADTSAVGALLDRWTA